MAGASPRAAVDAFVGRHRRAVECVARCEVFGSGHEFGPVHAVSLVPQGRAVDAPARLRSRGGRLDLLLGVSVGYTVAPLAGGGSSVAEVADYRYHILDANERELLAFHWHPRGVSPVRTPHLHVSCVPTLRLEPGGREAGLAPRSVSLGKMHVPTGHVLLEDVVALLIAEFEVAPLRADWADVLARGGAAG